MFWGLANGTNRSAKNSTQHMSASKFFSRVLKPQPKKYRYDHFFNMSRRDISVKQNFKKFHFTDFMWEKLIE